MKELHHSQPTSTLPLSFLLIFNAVTFVLFLTLTYNFQSFSKNSFSSKHKPKERWTCQRALHVWTIIIPTFNSVVHLLLATAVVKLQNSQKGPVKKFFLFFFLNKLCNLFSFCLPQTSFWTSNGKRRSPRLSDEGTDRTKMVIHVQVSALPPAALYSDGIKELQSMQYVVFCFEIDRMLCVYLEWSRVGWHLSHVMQLEA